MKMNAELDFQKGSQDENGCYQDCFSLYVWASV